MHLRRVIFPVLLVAFGGCVLPSYTSNSHEGEGEAGVGGTPASSGGSRGGTASEPTAGSSAGKGAAAGGGGSGGGGALTCEADEKPCAGSCVRIDDPEYGCGDTTCDKSSCPAAAASLACEGGACAPGSCGAGMKLCDGKCVSVSDPTYGCTATGCDDSPCPETTTGTLICSGSECLIGNCMSSTKKCGNKCVPFDEANGCGQLDRCETCGPFDTCKGGPPTKCTCVPDDAEVCKAVECGELKNRCGGDVNCGGCSAPNMCVDGKCVECTQPSDCPAVTCAKSVCNNNQCGIAPLTAATTCPGGGNCSLTRPGICERFVSQGTWNIDAVEVSRAHYQAFLSAKAGDTMGQSNACAFNGDYTPTHNWPPAAEDLQRPVVNVDWCDASAYCKWTGRRLCGLIGGGGGTQNSSKDPALGQWVNACTGGNANRTYAYGTTFVAGRCNDQAPAPVGSFPQCVGANSKLFDMSGNVMEWTDDCFDGFCVIRGAEFYIGDLEKPEDEQRCTWWYNINQPGDSDNVGLRCCSTP